MSSGSLYYLLRLLARARFLWARCRSGDGKTSIDWFLPRFPILINILSSYQLAIFISVCASSVIVFGPFAIYADQACSLCISLSVCRRTLSLCLFRLLSLFFTHTEYGRSVLTPYLHCKRKKEMKTAKKKNNNNSSQYYLIESPFNSHNNYRLILSNVVEFEWKSIVVFVTTSCSYFQRFFSTHSPGSIVFFSLCFNVFFSSNFVEVRHLTCVHYPIIFTYLGVLVLVVKLQDTFQPINVCFVCLTRFRVRARARTHNRMHVILYAIITIE